MKYLLASIFILLKLSATGQDLKKYNTIASLDDKSISLAIGQNNYTYDDSIQFRQSKRFENIILVNNKTKDTVELYNCENKNCSLDSSDLRSVLFDKKNHVVVLTLKFTENNNYGESGAYLINKTVNEIWSIDLKKRIFIAMNDYHYYGDFNSYYPPGTIESIPDTSQSVWDWGSHSSETEYSYHYDFRINEKAEIIISGLKSNFKITESNYLKELPDGNTKYPHYCECIQPDNKQGIYKYENGKFINIKGR